jgi:hypothetical protein
MGLQLDWAEVIGFLVLLSLVGGFHTLSDHQYELGLTGTAQPNFTVADANTTVIAYENFDDDGQDRISTTLRAGGSSEWFTGERDTTFDGVDYIEHNGAYYQVSYEYSTGLSRVTGLLGLIIGFLAALRLLMLPE